MLCSDAVHLLCISSAEAGHDLVNNDVQCLLRPELLNSSQCAPLRLQDDTSPCCRPYQRLSAYHLKEGKALLTWKMQSSKRGTCDGQHCRKLSTLGSYRYVSITAPTSCRAILLVLTS